MRACWPACYFTVGTEWGSISRKAIVNRFSTSCLVDQLRHCQQTGKAENVWVAITMTQSLTCDEVGRRRPKLKADQRKSSSSSTLHIASLISAFCFCPLVAQSGGCTRAGFASGAVEMCFCVPLACALTGSESLSTSWDAVTSTLFEDRLRWHSSHLPLLVLQSLISLLLLQCPIAV